MALLTVAAASRSGVDMTGAAATSGGDTFANTGHEILFVTNGDSGSHTVTVALQKELDGQSATARVVTVAAGKTEAIGPFQAGLYSDDDGIAHVTYSAVTSVTVKVLKVGAP